jgi:hypothetical protein
MVYNYERRDENTTQTPQVKKMFIAVLSLVVSSGFTEVGLSLGEATTVNF